MEIKFFYEDVIYRLGKKGNLQLGMVTENAEFASSDEESSDDEEEKLQKGTIRVAWHPSGDEQVVKEAKVGLADRSLMPGDVVRRLIKGKETHGVAALLKLSTPAILPVLSSSGERKKSL